ncbi:MAG: nitrate reductase [Defluviitaleaceae bacterium]|nr:nitrate reductase [Defluviitaleaceae bacterium]
MKRIMVDAQNCKGCKNCSIACMQSHRKDNPGGFHSLDLADPANESRNLILLNGNDEYKPLFCRHCAQPECVKACMSGAMEKDSKTGYVRHNAAKCASCFMCVMSCPYGVIKPDRATNSYIVKCDFCQQDGDDPCCVKACRSGAIYVKEVQQ